MNFSPQNTTTLENLLAALGNGMSGSSAGTILQQTLANQAAQQQARQAQYQNYAQTAIQSASSGLPYGQTSSLLDMLTPRPGLPNRAQNLLDQAYSGAPIPPQLQPGSGNPAGMQIGQMAPPPMVQNQLQSPLYTNQPDVQAAQAAAAQPPPPTAAQQSTQELGDLVAAINVMASQGMSGQDILAKIYANPQASGILAQNWAKITPLFPTLFR